MERNEVIEKLIANEIDTIQTMLDNGDTNYLYNIINGGWKGFEEYTNEELAEEFYCQFDELIQIN